MSVAVILTVVVCGNVVFSSYVVVQGNIDHSGTVVVSGMVVLSGTAVLSGTIVLSGTYFVSGTVVVSCIVVTSASGYFWHSFCVGFQDRSCFKHSGRVWFCGCFRYSSCFSLVQFNIL